MDIQNLITKGTFPRNYRLNQTPTSLNPALAYAMNNLAGLDPNDRVLDPCCGTATILIERQLLMQCICIGVDINPKVLTQAQENITLSVPVIARSGNDHDAAISINNASSSIIVSDESSHQPTDGASKKNPPKSAINQRESILLKHADIQDQKFPNGYFTKIISNLPYGLHSGSRQKNIKLYRFLAETSQNWLKKNGKIVLLTNSDKILWNAFADKPQLKFLNKIAIPNDNLNRHIYIYQKI